MHGPSSGYNHARPFFFALDHNPPSGDNHGPSSGYNIGLFFFRPLLPSSGIFFLPERIIGCINKVFLRGQKHI